MAAHRTREDGRHVIQVVRKLRKQSGRWCICIGIGSAKCVLCLCTVTRTFTFSCSKLDDIMSSMILSKTGYSIIAPILGNLRLVKCRLHKRALPDCQDGIIWRFDYLLQNWTLIFRIIQNAHNCTASPGSKQQWCLYRLKHQWHLWKRKNVKPLHYHEKNRIK